MSSVPYPPPPWHTRGWAVFAPYRVRAGDVSVPEGFTIESRAGITLGVLGLVDYRPPSPLSYRELVWMPARVSARREDGTLARGFYVQKMLVDDDGSLAAGREVWALPKQRARFTIEARTARVACEDGARLALSLGRSWPGLPLFRSRVVTLQARGGQLVRFRGDTRATLAPRSMSIASARGLDGTWRSLESARPLRGLGAELREFATTMQPPEVFALARR